MSEKLPHVALRDLLLSLFPVPALLKSTLLSLPDHEGPKVFAWLPGDTLPILSYYDQVVTILVARGLIDQDFFTSLATEVPRRTADIHLVATLWGYAAVNRDGLHVCSACGRPCRPGTP